MANLSPCLMDSILVFFVYGFFYYVVHHHQGHIVVIDVLVPGDYLLFNTFFN